MRVLFFVLILAGCFGEKKTGHTLEPISPELKADIDYGRELFVHTARYFGPSGKVNQTQRSRMNCQNCHLDAGTRPYGISLISSHARYPDYRAREGKVMTLIDRINNCFERPMNGQRLSLDSVEARALLAYFQFLSRGMVVGERVKGDRLNDMIELPPLAADPKRGKGIYEKECANCHGLDGLGRLRPDNQEFEFPPLWGPESFNEASTLHRNIKMAAFIKANMPFGTNWKRTKLSDQEALDVAAFVNDPSHPRPKSRWKDYPQVDKKPIDFPTGPYADEWPEEAHRLGPFLPIIESYRKRNQTAYY